MVEEIMNECNGVQVLNHKPVDGRPAAYIGLCKGPFGYRYVIVRWEPYNEKYMAQKVSEVSSAFTDRSDVIRSMKEMSKNMGLPIWTGAVK